MDEDTSATGGEAEAVDTGAADVPGTVTEETGSVTAEEIAAALGPKYRTVAPVKETTKEEVKDDDAESETDEDTDTESSDNKQDDTERPTKAKPVNAKNQEVASDPNIPDFSMTVTDEDGVTFKIAAGDDLDEALADANITKTSKIMSIMRQLDKLEAQKSDYEADQQKQADADKHTEAVANIQKGWDDEIKSLQAEKRIPTTAKGADNERVAEVYKYMAEQNDARIKAGRPTIGSFEDALDKLENKEAREAKVEAAKTAKDEARKNGALVGGSSAPATSGTPVYKAGSARNSGQALKALGIL